MNTPSRPEFGLALGGGTARGMAHVGVLKALDAAGRPPDAVAGTSFGAIIAGLYALGHPPFEIERIVRQQNIMELWAQGLDFGLHRAALMHGRRLSAWLDRKVFLGARLEDARMPLVIAATDLDDGSLVLLRQGSMAEAVRASCALPGFFAPVPRQERVLIDGGFVEPVPFRALATLAPRQAWGVHAGIEVEASVTLRWVRRMERTAAGRRAEAAVDRLRGRDPLRRLLRGLVLSLRSYRHGVVPPAGATLLRVDPHIAWWDFHRSPQAIAAGERAARRLLDACEGFAVAEATTP